MKNIVCYRNKKSQQVEILEAFAKSCGAEVFNAWDGIRDNGIIAFMGLQDGCLEMAKTCIEFNLDYIFIDHSYFPSTRGYKKDSYYRITRCGINATVFKKTPTNRLASLNVKCGPWKQSGTIIVLIPPSETMTKLLGLDGWTEATIRELQKHTTKPIVVKHKFDKKPLTDYLINAFALVSYNSMAAVEAAIYGVPVFVDKSSPANPIGRTDFSKIEQPIYPDRDNWLAWLSARQWNKDEILSGLAFQSLIGEEKV